MLNGGDWILSFWQRAHDKRRHGIGQVSGVYLQPLVRGEFRPFHLWRSVLIFSGTREARPSFIYGYEHGRFSLSSHFAKKLNPRFFSWVWSLLWGRVKRMLTAMLWSSRLHKHSVFFEGSNCRMEQFLRQSKFGFEFWNRHMRSGCNFNWSPGSAVYYKWVNSGASVRRSQY